VQETGESGYRPSVSAPDSQDEEASSGLPRLPPGRHGLTREFVVKNQRDRLTAGIIAAVAEHGYHDASVTRICAAAGVSRRTFYSYFSSKEECYLQAFDLISEHLSAAMREASAGEDKWAGRVRARIEAMLGLFALNPDLARFALIAPMRAGEQIAGRHRFEVERILQDLTCDLAADDAIRRPSPAVEQALMGGMLSLVARKVDRGEGQALTDLLPDLVELFLTPYTGRVEAARAAGVSPSDSRG
jgi:AcrR family transcriptional regulator